MRANRTNRLSESWGDIITLFQSCYPICRACNTYSTLLPLPLSTAPAHCPSYQLSIDGRPRPAGESGSLYDRNFRGGSHPRERCGPALSGIPGLSLPQLLRAEAAARPGKIKSCVFIFAWGGPAQQETFDMKPDAWLNIRGEFKPVSPTTSPAFSSASTSETSPTGEPYSAIIRSATHKNRIHNPVRLSRPDGPQARPRRGRIPRPARRLAGPGVDPAKVRPTEQICPAYVVLPIFANDINIPTPDQHAGFLGAAYDPLIVHADPSKPNFSVPALTAAAAELTWPFSPPRCPPRLLAQDNAQGGRPR